MAEQSKRQVVPYATLLTTLAILGGLIWAGRLRSFRPQISESMVRDMTGLEVVDARLWQDPLVTAAASRSPADRAAHRVESLAAEVMDVVGRQERLLIMPVMIPGGQYAEDRETRRRQRYAVVSGLGRKKYVPRRAEHIGYVETYWSESPVSMHTADETVEEDGELRVVRVPFEWFDCESKGHDSEQHDDADGSHEGERPHFESVLVLWVDEERIAGFGAIDELLRHFLIAGDEEGVDRIERRLDDETIAIRVLGPSNSASLMTFLRSEFELALGKPPPQRVARSSIVESIDLLVGLIDERQDLDSTQRAAIFDEATNVLTDELPNVNAEEPELFALDFVGVSEKVNDAILDRGDIDRANLEPAMRRWRLEQLRRQAPNTPVTSATAAVTLAQTSLEKGPVEPVTFHYESELIRELAKAEGEHQQQMIVEVLNRDIPDADSSTIAKTYPQLTRAPPAHRRTTRPRPSPPSPADGANDDGDADEGGGGDDDGDAGDAGGSDDESAPPPSRATDGEPLAPGALRGHLRFYSSRATAPVEGDDRLRMQLEALAVVHDLPVSSERFSRKDMARSISYFLTEDREEANEPTRFVETILPDSALAQMLIEELVRRRIRFDGSQHIALIGEWDTFYGRRFFDVFREEMAERIAEENGSNVDSSEFVHRISYLRGLDGQVPGLKDERPELEDSKESSGSGTIMPSDPTDFEYPAGRSQFDSMRRMAAQIRTLEKSKRQSGETLAAVGLIGSDVYDKLLVLQALRPYLPNAVFFTTDLDARLTHASQFKWSRNLIVASSFGLELSLLVQQDTPPFRDSYQTSTFLATLLALDGVQHQLGRRTIDVAQAGSGIVVTGTDSSGNEFVQRELTPRLFEVGRSGAVDITPDFSRSALAAGPESDWPSRIVERSRLHPKRYHPGGVRVLNRASWIALIVILSIVILSGVIAPLHRQLFSPHSIEEYVRYPAGTLLLLTVAGIGGLAIIIAADQGRGTGEPFAVFEGISAWPSMFVRLIVIFLCIGAYLLERYELRRNDRALADMLALPPRPEGRSVVRLRSIVRSWRRELRRRVGRARGLGKLSAVVAWMTWVRGHVTVNFWAGWPHPNERRALVIWFEYQRRSRATYRWMRLLTMVALFSALIAVIWHLFRPPPMPVRGSLAYTTGFVITAFSMVLTGMLTLYAVDLIRLCQQFVKLLALHPTEWPASSLASNLVVGRRLHDEDAADYLDFVAIYNRTKSIVPVAIYPFVAISLLLVSRNSYFDKWEWPIFIFLFFGLLLGYALTCAIMLRVSANRSREAILARLQHRLVGIKVEAGTDPAAKAREEQVELLIAEIQEARGGAYSAIWNRPVVQAMVPLGGVALVFLTEILSALGI